jgi:gluconate 5-dehydrogenase
MENKLFTIEGKTIIVTGASRGIGRGLALAFAKAGANLVIASRSFPELEELAGEIKGLGREVLAVKTDVTDKKDVQRLVESAKEKFASLDVLFNNAGMNISGLLSEEVAEEQFTTIMDCNLKGMFLCGTMFAKVMIPSGRGKIINMSSVLGERVWPKTSVYCTSKGALNQLTRVWAADWGCYNITVNALAPSFVVTPLNKRLFDKPEFRQKVLSHLLIGRIGEIEDIVGPAIFLASEASNYMTGQILTVDGGWTCL